MTIPANLGAENQTGAIPVSIVTGAQGGPYASVGTGGVPVSGGSAVGNSPTLNPIVCAGVDGSGNVQYDQLNQAVTLLASAARTATTASAAQTNLSGSAATAILNVTVASGTGGLKLQFQEQDPVSGNWVSVNTAPAAITATGTFLYQIGAGVGAGSSPNSNASQFCTLALSTPWRVQVTAGDSSSYTYSVSACTVIGG